MNKWQIIRPVMSLAIVAVAATGLSANKHYRAYVIAQTRMIGEDLITKTNSRRLFGAGPSLHDRLSEMLSPGARVADVLAGDEPAPIGNGTASSRLILSNAQGHCLGIRLKQMREGEGFRALGFWTITDPGGAANPSQPVSPQTNRTPATAGSDR